MTVLSVTFCPKEMEKRFLFCQLGMNLTRTIFQNDNKHKLEGKTNVIPARINSTGSGRILGLLAGLLACWLPCKTESKKLYSM